jgi:hypothetical protein
VADLGAGIYTMTCPDGSEVTWLGREVAGGIVTVGEPILTSEDGTAWTKVPNEVVLGDVATNGTQWVAVGAAGAILTSPDGVHWTSQTSGTSEDLAAVASNGNLWVAGGWNGTLLTSTDGITWTQRPSGTIYIVTGVATDGDDWVAVTGGDVILHSSNGIDWTSATVTTQAQGGYSDVATNGLYWVAVDFFGEVVVAQQPDNWQIVIDPDGDPNLDLTLRAVAVDPSTWAITGWDGTKSLILTSIDLAIWTKRAEFTNYLLDLGSNGSLWVGVGVAGAIVTSSDHGITWSGQASGVLDGLSAVAFS